MAVYYEAPDTLERAVELLDSLPGARLLAGGTDLLVQIRSGGAMPPLFVDLKRIDAMNSIVFGAGYVDIGAAVPTVRIVESPQLQAAWPGLCEAADMIGSVQIQSRATLGGNLCNGSPAADTVPALLVNDAQCLIQGPAGQRMVAVCDFQRGPRKSVLGTAEIVVALRLPLPAAGTSDAYFRMIPRSEMDIALVGAAASVTIGSDGVCVRAALAIGAVAPTARLVAAAREILVGSRLDEATLAEASWLAAQAAEPISDKRASADYRRRITAVLTRRALLLAVKRARRMT
jgi:CO/xanthine dehydrogenase FAD-binding subunit